MCLLGFDVGTPRLPGPGRPENLGRDGRGRRDSHRSGEGLIVLTPHRDPVPILLWLQKSPAPRTPRKRNEKNELVVLQGFVDVLSTAKTVVTTKCPLPSFESLLSVDGVQVPILRHGTLDSVRKNQEGGHERVPCFTKRRICGHTTHYHLSLRPVQKGLRRYPRFRLPTCHRRFSPVLVFPDTLSPSFLQAPEPLSPTTFGSRRGRTSPVTGPGVRLGPRTSSTVATAPALLGGTGPGGKVDVVTAGVRSEVTSGSWPKVPGRRALPVRPPVRPRLVCLLDVSCHPGEGCVGKG